MLKITHICESTATGTLSMLRLSANAQASSGSIVKVAYSCRSETPDNLKDLFNLNVDLVNVQMNSFSDKLKSFIILRRYLRKSNADVVFMHSSFAGFIGRLSSLGLSGSYYYIPHCISFMRQDISYIRRLFFASLEWMASIKKAEYVACSESEGSQIRKYIPFRKCHVIPNAVDTIKWHTESDWTSKKNIIITVGQIRLQKDPERFAEIANEILSVRDDVEFLWVGDGDPDLRNSLESAGVIVTGWKHPDEVKSLLVDSRYYLSTALWEGMPVSPLEAMLSGCLAILSDCAGNVDIVVDDKTGFIFGSTDEAVNKVIYALDHQKECADISLQGKNHCKSYYSQERYINDFNSLIMEGLSK